MSGAPTSLAMATLRRALQVKDPVFVPDGTDDTTRLACWMLTAIQPWPEAVREVMDGQLAAHREAQADGAVWRRLRRAAVLLGDDTDVEVQAYGQVAEAAAWPLATGQAGLVEMMQAICQLRARQASTASGWTSEDEQAAHAILGRIADGDGMTRPAREEIPELFSQEDPVLEKRFSLNLTAANAAYGSFRAEVVAWLAGATRIYE